MFDPYDHYAACWVTLSIAHQVKLEVGQVKSESHLPEWTGKMSPHSVTLPLLNVSFECLGQVYLTRGPVQFGSDLPEGRAFENPLC